MINYFALGALLLETILNLIFRKKANIAFIILNLLVAGSFFIFKIEQINDYLYLFPIYSLTFTTIEALFILPKKVTRNLTEYDYFELERVYNNLVKDNNNLKDRYLSTISLIDEGIIFYENNIKDVILSKKASLMLGCGDAEAFLNHIDVVFKDDREMYRKTVEDAPKTKEYDIKYRILKGEKICWVRERGKFIGIDHKRSIIASVELLDISSFQTTSYVDIDNLFTDNEMYPTIKELTKSGAPFALVMMKIGNLKVINKEASREIGTIGMNDFIQYLKEHYVNSERDLFRYSGAKLLMVIRSEETYKEFYKEIGDSKSKIQTFKVGFKDKALPLCIKFGVLYVQNSRPLDSLYLVKMSEKALKDAMDSKKNYAIYGGDR